MPQLCLPLWWMSAPLELFWVNFSREKALASEGQGEEWSCGEKGWLRGSLLLPTDFPAFSPRSRPACHGTWISNTRDFLGPCGTRRHMFHWCSCTSPWAFLALPLEHQSPVYSLSLNFCWPFLSTVISYAIYLCRFIYLPPLLSFGNIWGINEDKSCCSIYHWMSDSCVNGRIITSQKNL